MARWLFAGIRLPLIVGGAILVGYAVFFAGPYDLRVLTLCGIYALLVLGFQFVFGHAGAVSLAQATFFGIGGYVTGVLATRFGFPFLITFPLSIAGPALLAVIIAVPVLKLEEHYFSLATLGIGLVVLLLAIQWSDVTGGANGLPGIPGITLPGFVIADRRSVLWFVWGIVAIACLLAYQVTRGLHGHAYHLMRENREAAASLGLNIAELRFGAFVLSAAYGGAAGALMAHVIYVVSPENLDLALMVMCLTMTVIGGRTHIAGAILGACLIVYLREWFRVLENYYMIAYGTAALAALILAPYGLVGAIERLRAFLFKTSLAEPPPMAGGPLHKSLHRAPLAVHQELLEVENVALAFGGVKALDGVGLSCKQGEIVGTDWSKRFRQDDLAECHLRILFVRPRQCHVSRSRHHAKAGLRDCAIGHGADLPAHPSRGRSLGARQHRCRACGTRRRRIDAGDDHAEARSPPRCRTSNCDLGR